MERIEIGFCDRDGGCESYETTLTTELENLVKQHNVLENQYFEKLEGFTKQNYRSGDVVIKEIDEEDFEGYDILTNDEAVKYVQEQIEFLEDCLNNWEENEENEVLAILAAQADDNRFSDF